MSTFTARRLERSAFQTLNGTPEEIFPLLCPVREYEWIEHWRCAMIYSQSGRAEDNCIFTTRFPGDDSDDVWVVCHHQPPRQIQFVRVNDFRVMRYTITLEQTGPDSTGAVWHQLITALNDKGNERLSTMSEHLFRQEIARLETMINHFLATGSMLKQADRSA